MKVYEGINVPIKSWCNEPEDGAMSQAENLSALPFLHRHVALMPDTHQGYGMPIGGVIATKDVVIPNAVGVDIGCGMCCVKTDKKELDIDVLKKIMSDIRTSIPVGFKHHTESHAEFMPEDKDMLLQDESSIVRREYTSACNQLGTLGGGNHFIEIQRGDDGFIYIMIHSGSRNIGLKVAQHYNKLAQTLNEEWYSSVPKNHELAFLPFYSNEGRMYMAEMDYCLDFAKVSRGIMMIEVLDIIFQHANGVTPTDPIDVHHNYATMEHHFGKNVMVHRKGATSAKEGQLGIIPGSQGTSSYIVKGKGNEESFKSCSHGAGRAMGRKQAQRELSLENEIKILEDQGIIHSIRNEKDLDEASNAYKNIETVMEEQKDLVDIVVKLTPLAVIKG